MSLSHFDERSGIVAAETPWGRWWQTVSEVFIEVNIPPGTPGKDCKITIKPNYLECRIKDKELIKGNLFKTVRPDESTWTVEERKKVMILLDKAEKFEHKNMWTSLLEKEYIANPLIQHEMRKKLDLEKFQIENPGFDFSGAKLAKCYDKPRGVLEKNSEEKDNCDKPEDAPESNSEEKNKCDKRPDVTEKKPGEKDNYDKPADVPEKKSEEKDNFDKPADVTERNPEATDNCDKPADVPEKSPEEKA